MIILDTNVLSELMRPTPSLSVVNWVAKYPFSELFTTSITEAEIFCGIELLAKGRRREQLLAAADAMFAKEFTARVHEFDSRAARAYSSIAAQRRSLGLPITHADAQIAAIAKTRNARLATRNVEDFRDCGIEVIDPWTAE